MKIKTNDKVKIIVGKDSGKSGKVVKALPAKEKVIVEGLNLFSKHVKAGGKGTGQKISVAMPVDISNVVLVCPSCSKETKVGYMILENGEKHRICKKCKQTVDAKLKDK